MRIILILLLCSTAALAGEVDYNTVPRDVWVFDGDGSAVIRSMTHDNVWFGVFYDEKSGCQPYGTLLTMAPELPPGIQPDDVLPFKGITIKIDAGIPRTLKGARSFYSSPSVAGEYIFMPLTGGLETLIRRGRFVQLAKPLSSGRIVKDIFNLKGSSRALDEARRACAAAPVDGEVLW